MITVRGQPGKKVSEIPSQPTSQEWWHPPLIPATREAVGRRIVARQKWKTLPEK
jgi:hypothetical protein